MRGLVCPSMLLHCLACALTVIKMPSNRFVSEQSPCPIILGVYCARNRFVSDLGKAFSLAQNGINKPLSLRSCPVNFLDSSIQQWYSCGIIKSGAVFTLSSQLSAAYMHTYCCQQRSYCRYVSATEQSPIQWGLTNSWSWSGTNPGWFGCNPAVSTTNLSMDPP